MQILCCAIISVVVLWVQRLYPVQKTLFHSSLPHSYNFCASSSTMFPEPLGKGCDKFPILTIFLPFPLCSLNLGSVCDTDVSFMAEHSTVTYSLHFDQLWVSVLNIIHYIEKLLWWRVHRYLETFRRQYNGGKVLSGEWEMRVERKPTLKIFEKVI